MMWSRVVNGSVQELVKEWNGVSCGMESGRR